MGEGFVVDTATLDAFRAAADRARGRVGELRGMLDAAALPPGTFTRTPGGQLADASHAEVLNGMRAALDEATQQLSAMAEATTTTIDNYESTDTRHATAMADIERQVDSTGGY